MELSFLNGSYFLEVLERKGHFLCRLYGVSAKNSFVVFDGSDRYSCIVGSGTRQLEHTDRTSAETDTKTERRHKSERKKSSLIGTGSLDEGSAGCNL